MWLFTTHFTSTQRLRYWNFVIIAAKSKLALIKRSSLVKLSLHTKIRLIRTQTRLFIAILSSTSKSSPFLGILRHEKSDTCKFCGPCSTTSFRMPLMATWINLASDHKHLRSKLWHHYKKHGRQNVNSFANNGFTDLHRSTFAKTNYFIATRRIFIYIYLTYENACWHNFYCSTSNICLQFGNRPKPKTLLGYLGYLDAITFR